MSTASPTPGELAEQAHLLDPLDTDGGPLQRIATDHGDRIAAVVALYDRDAYQAFLDRCRSQNQRTP